MLMDLPRNLAALCKVAGKEHNDRFNAMSCVQLLDQGDGLYRAEATNGRIAAIIAGPFDYFDSPGEFSPWPTADAAANVLMPADHFAKALSGIKPDKGQPDTVMLATKDGQVAVYGHGSNRTFLRWNGRFPNIDLVLPRRLPLVRVRVDPGLLITLLQVAKAVNEAAVELLYYSPVKPIGLIASNENGQAFDGLIVPLAQPERKGEPCNPSN